jgi:type I restriction enzyme S subunit
MNPARLLAHFERLADAPDAIPRLRRFILDLAVRGKLVPQELSDEPAAELLKRIAAEKIGLVKAGDIKPERIGKGPVTSVARFALPKGWVWTELQAHLHLDN